MASLVIIVLLSVLARVTVLDMFAVVIGLFVAGLAYLSYRGWVDVRWAAMGGCFKKYINKCVRTDCSCT